MKKIINRTIALSVACVLTFSMAACSKGNKDKETLVNDPTPTVEGSAETPSPEAQKDETYTLNLSIAASPTNWNPHTWESSADDLLRQYCAPGLVDTTIAEDGVNFAWVYEMADAISDVTATFADKEKYNITEDSGRVYQIDLNKLATWEDGTSINADTYIYSMKMLLDSGMKNYRANTYFDGTTAIYNARNYFNNDKAGTPIYSSIYDGAAYGLAITDTDKMYAGLNEVNAFFGSSLADAYEKYGAEKFTGSDGKDYYQELVTLIGDKEFIPASEEVLAAVKGICSLFGSGYDEEFMEMLFYSTGTYVNTPWEDVGLVKTGDYQLLYITQTPVTMFYFLSNMTSNWIVKEDIYESNKQTINNLTATKYGTSVDTYMSYGPYKLVGFETDKQFIMEKNDKWYGYKDGKHKGEYQTTAVKYDIVADHNTALQLFNSGALDTVALLSDDMTTYRMSDYLMKTDRTYTFRWIFSTDIKKLKGLEAAAADGSNKKVLSYDDFRKALSLSMERTKFVTEATAGYKPAYFLFNYLYYTDIENNTESQYRNTKEAKEAVLRLYGITYGAGTPYATVDDAFAAVTGYDLEAAKELFQSVYEKAKADGNYTDGQEIKINCMASAASSLTAQDIAQQDLMNEFVKAATVGTGFEDKITFTFKSGSSTRYEDVANGLIEMIRGAWGGAAFYPFSTVRVYTEPDYMGGISKIHESSGWNPSVEKLDIVYDFNGDGTAETKTDTFQEWAKSINGSGEYAKNPEAALVILSYLETGVLSAYQCIPWATEAEVELYSKQIEYATYDYNIMYEYGGVRLITYNYSDAEWDEYIKSQGGTLSYE
ncbi:MAG TPA: hypothetical protein DHW61_01825 [Lachnoclostridium phytofermentans]|uniref:Solute-binding protein family 5 domain-containing protein n=1 Tax=Lachnoclostridium phytofermentans TaxID=66219 RepID=A0A3D2X377_9FIRM|nr:ABC transporter substrate-binding protein [Lachnoclostridium sp.]HCL01147.1 hypothetical protein [Lachnoclostridium phytofermentans]